MKILILGLMATLAFAAPPMGMPPMMMPNMLMGGSPLSLLAGGIPPEAMEMLKNLKPEDIKAAITNMPQEMKEMMKGMGISEEDLDEAVQNLPEDLTPLVEKVTEKLGSGDIKGLEEHVDTILPKKLKDRLKSTAINALRDQMTEMGMDVKEDDDMSTIVEKAKEAITEKLREGGIDIEDPEAMQAKFMAELRKITDATPDESDVEVRMKFAKQLLEDLKEEGFDVDPEKPGESVQALKDKLQESLKKMDIDIGGDLDVSNLGEALKKVVLSGKLGHPLHLMMTAMTTFSSGGQGGMPPQQMMMPVPVQQGPMGYHQGPHMRPYVQGAEDALIHVFGGDDEVVQHLMEVREGAMRGAIPEASLFELMKDVLHYRLEARVLLAQNRMLEERLAVSHVHSIPPFMRSPYGLRVLGCRF